MIRTIFFFLIFSLNANSQDMYDLLSFKNEPVPVKSIFKTTKIVNGHSAKLVSKGDLLLLIQHRFGPINSGAYNLYGLDNAQVRIGLEYGISEKFNLSLGRSSFLKTIDITLKALLLNQISNNKASFKLNYLSSIFFKQEIENKNINEQLSYLHQFLIAKKVNDKFSLQLSPTLVHYNYVYNGQKNDKLAIGTGIRYKINNRLSFNSEYFFQFYNINESISPLSFGFDIETGGHVFQLHLTNVPAMFEKAFIFENFESWTDGDIYFGFNISRYFTIK
tara:strand:- start:2826 stop:3656 length:831 start_codon:yes stop_codon:yes gene_type:complete